MTNEKERTIIKRRVYYKNSTFLPLSLPTNTLVFLGYSMHLQNLLQLILN